MDMQPVSSSNIAAIGYDAETQELSIRFHSGIEWTYVEVPQDVYDDLLSAASVGKAFNAKVKGVYEGSAS